MSERYWYYGLVVGVVVLVPVPLVVDVLVLPWTLVLVALVAVLHCWPFGYFVLKSATALAT